MTRLTNFFKRKSELETSQENSSKIEKKRKKIEDEQDTKSFKDLEDKYLHESWSCMLKSEIEKPYFKRLKHFLEEELKRGKTIFPPKHLIYSWSNYCSFDQIKIVIIGQDPYHNYDQAMGLCFSVPMGTILPPSLKNIFKELKSEYSDFEIPNHGCLYGWAKQGVLLLNATLTVEAHKAYSHTKKGWEEFTDKIITCISNNRQNVVFMLWGGHAQQKEKLIKSDCHCILKSAHPSPLSASRGFLGNNHFIKANEYLNQKGIKEIDWSFLPNRENL
ncbi:uracil-DNA glycosylase [Rozella allomycis CSF55]|uniref:Uracil-DNA glycosylase n=1 Tax=Rozella allomycis (strain CSF55) TaxID=988480 RepID=A0A4P9YHQ9_ROZAC|nr:uracil-DNA glycosylase [Rozella allomycis CSF55]